MDSSCLYCGRALHTNDVLETLAVGRRLAYDKKRGRLWAVCLRCGQWNLAPPEDRWEAIEECEARFRATKLRAATANIALAQVAPQLQLIRVGKLVDPEFAAWRYGSELGRRRRSLITLGAVALSAGAGAAVAGVTGLVAAASAVAGWETGQWLNRVRHRGPRIPLGGGREITVGRDQLNDARVMMGAEWGNTWGLAVPNGDHYTVLAGNDALRGAGVLLAGINRFGARSWEIDLALDIIGRHRGARDCFRCATFRSEHERYRLARFPIGMRLALEMAAHEEAERRALEGELALYERRWRRAEAEAAIEDDLLLPPGAAEFLSRHRHA